METGTGIVRAMIKVMQYKEKINVINMSYGEHTNWSNSGRIGELVNEVIDKYGVTWVSSAGNLGPALCTVSKYIGKFSFGDKKVIQSRYQSLLKLKIIFNYNFLKESDFKKL